MTRKIVAVVFLFTIVCWAVAQNAPAKPEEPQRFVSTSELVTVPVVVTDKSGKPVHGLTRDDFSVVEDEKTRAVATLEELQNSSSPVRPASPAHTDSYENYFAQTEKPQRLTLIVLDLVNTPFLSQANVRAELLKMLAKGLRPDEPTALFTIGGGGVKQIHPFTTDPRVLIAALRKVTGKVERDESVNNEILTSQQYMDEVSTLQSFSETGLGLLAQHSQKEAIRTTLRGMEQIANAFAGMPGRKSLVWATSGFPFLIDDPLSLTGFGTDMVQDYERTWRVLNTANIAVYPVDAEGVSNPTFASDFDVTRRMAPRRNVATRALQNRYQRNRDTLESFAEATGGHPCLNNNDLASCFERAAHDSDSYYLLTYYLPASDRKPGWHRLKVNLARHAGLQIRARSGFFLGEQKAATPESRKQELAYALLAPLDYTGVRINIRWDLKGSPAAPAYGKSPKIFRVTMPPGTLTIDTSNENRMDLDVAAMAFDARGKPISDFWKKLDANLRPENVVQMNRSGFFYQDAIGLPKGQYTVRFVVRDNLTGKMGSVVAPVAVD